MLRLLCRCVVTAVVTAALALAYSYGTAKAAVPTGDTINQPMPASTQWQGQLYATGLISDPTQCPSQLADPGNVLCDHFQLQTQAAGPVRTVLTWSDTLTSNDFDVIVCQPAVDPVPDDDMCVGGNQVAIGTSQTPEFESATWNANAGATYEIRVLPFFVLMSDYQGCAEYTTSNVCPPNPIPPLPQPEPAAAFFQGCGNDMLADRKFDGSGEFPSPTTEPDKYSMNVERKLVNGRLKLEGKVNFKEKDPFQFKSKKITCAFFQDGVNSGQKNVTEFRGRVTIRGFGDKKIKDGSPNDDSTKQRVCFEITAADNGDPGEGRDDFNMRLLPLVTNMDGSQTCGVPQDIRGGTLTKGNNRYKTRPN